MGIIITCSKERVFCIVLFCFVLGRKKEKLLQAVKGRKEGSNISLSLDGVEKKKENAGDAGTDTLILRRSRTQLEQGGTGSTRQREGSRISQCPGPRYADRVKCDKL